LLADLTGDVDGFGEDIRWLLERLHSRETLRIDCGGEGVEVHGEPPWGKDRFFAGGYASKIPALEIAGTRDAAEQPLYRTCRTFVDGAGQAAYRVPLPRGRFRVTLHFAETWFQASGLRRFDVLMEKQEVLESHEPFAVGFAMADRQTFEVEVVDGILDIAFVRRTEGAQVCGIEIDTLD
jgi:hypothetical protein